MPPLFPLDQNGQVACVKLLVNYNAGLDKKCLKGKTALDYAKLRNKQSVVDLLEDVVALHDGDEEEGAAPGDGFSATQRSKLKRQALSKKTEGNSRTPRKEGGKGKQGTGFNANLAAIAANAKSEGEVVGRDGSRPVWEELMPVIAGAGGKLQPLRELNVLRADSTSDRDKAGWIDPFLWRCSFINRLQVRLPAGALTVLPTGVGKIVDLQTLILTENALSVLPEEITQLRVLKVLEVDKNRLQRLPESMAELADSLEVLNIAGNLIEDLEELQELTGLCSLNVDNNKLTALDLPYAEFTRLAQLSASGNQIVDLDPDIGLLPAAVSILLCDNMLKTVPGQLGCIKAKKLQMIDITGNPLKDRRLLKIMGGVADGKPIKELLKYMEKQPKAKQQQKETAAERKAKKQAKAAARAAVRAAVTPPEAPKTAEDLAKAEAMAAVEAEAAAVEMDVKRKQAAARKAERLELEDRMKGREESRREENEQTKGQTAAKRAQKTEAEEKRRKEKEEFQVWWDALRQEEREEIEMQEVREEHLILLLLLRRRRRRRRPQPLLLLGMR
jgi:leucine-rich repeat protein SHOC2